MALLRRAGQRLRSVLLSFATTSDNIHSVQLLSPYVRHFLLFSVVYIGIMARPQDVAVPNHKPCFFRIAAIRCSASRSLWYARDQRLRCIGRATRAHFPHVSADGEL